jgi:protein-disulfide isomerase
MRKLILALIAFTILFTGQACAENVGAKVEKGMTKFFKENNIPLSLKIDVIQKIEEPKGLYFIMMTLKDERSGRTQEQFAFTDGKYIIPDILTIDSNTSIKDKLMFDSADKVDIDVSKLSFFGGNKNSKHVIIEVSDFQCPYCKKAYAYLHEAIENEKIDVAVYMMHLPLSFHPKAMLYASIFEAGSELGVNFGGELFATDKEFDAKSDEEIINIFAAKTKDAEKFKALVKSPSIKGKIEAQAKMAGDLGITGTPHIYFDGKPVGGYKESLFDLGLDSLK